MAGMSGMFGKTVRTAAALAAACACVCSCASFEVKPVTEYQPDKKGEKRTYQIKKLRVALESEPDRGRPEAIFKVERCQVDYMWRKSVTQNYKIWDDGRPREKAEGKEKTSVDTQLIPEPVWTPWKGQKMTIKVSESAETFEIETDDQGFASFDVSKFSQCWIEGRDLTVTFSAQIPDYPEMPENFWEEAKSRKKLSMPDFMKSLGKFGMTGFENSFVVDRSVLEKIFERS